MSRHCSGDGNILRSSLYRECFLPTVCTCVSTGNPLTQEIMSLYQEPDGTRRLLNYLLDNLAGAIKRSRCLRQFKICPCLFFFLHFLSRIASWTVVVHVSQYSLLVLGWLYQIFTISPQSSCWWFNTQFPIGFCLAVEIHYCLKIFSMFLKKKSNVK